jgi:hypothetical protein
MTLSVAWSLTFPATGKVTCRYALPCFGGPVAEVLQSRPERQPDIIPLQCIGQELLDFAAPAGAVAVRPVPQGAAQPAGGARGGV